MIHPSSLLAVRRLDRIFTIVLLFFGSILLGNYALAPEGHIARPIHGFAVETNGDMIELKKLIISLDVKSGGLGLYGEFGYVNATRDNGKAFSIVIVLPFHILAKNTIPYYTPKIDDWKAINTNATDIAASAVSAKFLVNSTRFHKTFSAEFIVTKTYADSHRGIYKVALPLDAGIDGMYFPNLQPFEKESGVYCCQESAETDVYLIIPESATNIQSFPSAKLTIFSRYYDNATLNSVEWTLTQRTQVSVSYVDESEQFTYEISAILGSLLLGAGISGIAYRLREYSTGEGRDEEWGRRKYLLPRLTKNRIWFCLLGLVATGIVISLIKKRLIEDAKARA